MKTHGQREQQPGDAVERRPHVRRTELLWPRPRDLEVLKWTCEQCAARLDHVEAVAGCSRQVANRIVARLRDAGLARTRRYLIGEPMWVLPTGSGLRISDRGGQPWIPSALSLAHLAAVNSVRLHIQGRTPEAEWIAERQLRSEHHDERHKKGKYANHLPDGVAIYEQRAVAIEVELHYKGRRATGAILDELTRRYDTTLYYCSRLAYRHLTQLEQTGRWPGLGVRPLPGAE